MAASKRPPLKRAAQTAAVQKAEAATQQQHPVAM
jgi:hypothetical protein